MKTGKSVSPLRNMLLFFLLCVLTMPASAALTVFLEVYGTSCDGNNGAVFATTTGGEAPYTYSWSNGMTDPEIYGLVPGEYTVTVTDNLGAQGSNTCLINFIGGVPDGSLLFDNIAYGALSPCIGECNGGVRLYLLRQAGGYNVSVTPNLNIQILPYPILGEPENASYWQRYEILGACAGQSYDLYVTSSCGSGSTSFEVFDLIEPVVGPLTTSGSCTGASDGSVSGEVTIAVNTMPVYVDEFWHFRAVDDQGTEVIPSISSFYIPGTYNFQCLGLHPGEWTLRFTTEEGEFSAQAPCVYEVPFTVADLGAACSTVSGMLHFETDMDCVQDGVEAGIPYQLLRATPGPLYGITAADGSYSIALPYGSYSLEQLNPDAVQLCPPAAPVDFVVSNGINAEVDLADSMLTPFDMGLFVMSGIARVGFPVQYTLTLINSSGGTGEEITVTLSHDPIFSFISGSPGAINSPGEVQWTLPALGPFQQRSFQATLQVPTDPALLGYVHQYTATATSSIFEPNTANNTYGGQGTILASYDPNDKVGTANASRSTTEFLLEQDEWVDYVIRFQNTGTDTAFTVAVHDAIEPDLDLESFQILGSSHHFVPSFGEEREFVFTFNDILLPDSATDVTGSQGFVAFRLRPQAGLLPGGAIENVANIYFDFNEPVITEPSVLTAEFATGMLTQKPEQNLWLMPNPTNGSLEVRVSENAAVALLQVVSVDGRTVLQQRMQGLRTLLDVTSLASGLYTLNWRNANGTVSSQRFVRK